MCNYFFPIFIEDRVAVKPAQCLYLPVKILAPFLKCRVGNTPFFIPTVRL